MVTNKVHSRVGLITNSSSETYVWPLDGIENTLRAMGERMITAFGIDATFDEVFEIRKSLSGAARDNARYNKPDWAPEGFAQRLEDAQMQARDLLIPDGTTEQWYKLPNADEIRLAMKQAGDRVVEQEINLDEVPVGGGFDGYEGSNGNIDFTLVVKATGVTFNFDSIFDSMYGTESYYNG